MNHNAIEGLPGGFWSMEASLDIAAIFSVIGFSV